MQRSKKVVVLAHCLLNVNTKVRGLGDYEAVHPVVSDRIAQGWAALQLPCPEVTYLGMKRWGMTKEQYDTASYRRHCRELLAPVLDTLAELAADGCRIEIVGVDGSPSCGVTRTCTGWRGGEPDVTDIPPAQSVEGVGILMDELRVGIQELGIEVAWSAIDE